MKRHQKTSKDQTIFFAVVFLKYSLWYPKYIYPVFASGFEKVASWAPWLQNFGDLELLIF